MPGYRFSLARPRERAFVHIRGDFDHDAAAIAHALALGASHPQASSVTIASGDRVIARIALSAFDEDESVSRTVRDSRALVDQSRDLLDATARWSGRWQGGPET